jgi:RHS repeat-associated protein
MRLINAKLGIEKNNSENFEKQLSYVLDLVDNIRRITETKDSTTTTIETTINNRNQYTKFGNLNLSYDSNGNLKQKGNKNFSYDYKNQLVKYTDPDKTVEFRYDPFGRRIQKKVELNNSQSSQITNYYHEGYRVIEERDNSDRVTKQYVYGSGIDELLRMDIYENQTPTPYYFHHNLIGSITGITDENGNLIELIEYDPYGKPYFLKPTGNPQNPYESSESSTTGNTTLFQGREYDSETGLYSFRARYYDPELGRFLQPDPLGYQDSMNLYQAFNCNPVNFLDPMGERIVLSDAFTESEKALVYYYLLQLTSDILEPPDPKTGEIKISVKKAKIREKRYGTILLRRVIESPIVITIGPSSENRFYKLTRYIGLNLSFQKKDRLYLVYDPVRKKNILENTPFYITVAHELIHADHFIRGISDYLRVWGELEYIDEKGDYKVQEAMISEFETVGLYNYKAYGELYAKNKEIIEKSRNENITENQIRIEHRLKRRVKY